MLKSGSDMMAAAERRVHSLEEFEVLNFLSLVKSIPQKSVLENINIKETVEFLTCAALKCNWYLLFGYFQLIG